MASRILTFVSCTLYFSVLVIITVVGLTSIIIGFIGLGLYIPTLINFLAYARSSCLVYNHQYDICQQNNDDSCYSVVWSVGYILSNNTLEQYIFTTIKKSYHSPNDALNSLQMYKNNASYTCYYHTKNISDVHWKQPSSPMPYFTMMVVGFSLTVLYFLIIGSITIYRCIRR